MSETILKSVGYLVLLALTAALGFLSLFKSWWFLPVFAVSLVGMFWVSQQRIVDDAAVSDTAGGDRAHSLS